MFVNLNNGKLDLCFLGIAVICFYTAWFPGNSRERMENLEFFN